MTGDFWCTTTVIFLCAVAILLIGILWGWWVTRSWFGRKQVEFVWTCGVCSMRFEIRTNDHKMLIRFRDKHLKTHKEE